MIGITPLFSDKDIERWFSIFKDEVDEKIYKLFQAAGEVFVAHARKNGAYLNHTGNLRSSIGYVVAKKGNVISENFKLEKVGSEGAEGLEKAKRLSEVLAQTHNSDYVLIGVAGMEYAVYVEAIDGKDVIDGSTRRTQEWMRKAIQSVFNKSM